MKLLLLALFISFTASAKTQLNSSLILMGDTELNKLSDMIAKASFYRNKSINIIPTIYVSLDSSKQVTGYFHRDENYKMKPITKDYINHFGAALARSLALGNTLGLTFYLTPHVDDINGAVWRNNIKFDPLQKIKGFSYYDIFAYPIKMIFKRSKKPVYFSLSGEMGTSLYSSFKSYTKIIKGLPKNIKGGVSFNYNKIFGSTKILLKKDKRAFFRSLDFIGFSNYMPVRTNCTKNDFHKHIKNFRQILKIHGVHKNIPLHFNEVGIGGGSTLFDLKTIAHSAEEAASVPYSGVKGTNPWEIPELNEMRKKYHSCLMDFLKDETIEAAFLWNLDSWDMFGYHDSNKIFKDQDLANKIKAFNLR